MNRTARGMLVGVLVHVLLTTASNPLHAEAASLSFGSPAPLPWPLSKDIVALPVLITLDAEECINAAEIDIVISRPDHSIIRRDITSDLFSIWENPTASTPSEHTEILLGSTTPICGGSSFDPITIATITTASSSIISSLVYFGEHTSIALADGEGTLASISTTPLEIK